jgi:hypothetical protein
MLVPTDIDGTNKQTLVSSGQFAVHIFGSNLQVSSTNIYWVEGTYDRNFYMLVRTDIDGTNKQTLVTSGKNAVQNFGSKLQVTSTNIYWVETSNDGNSIDTVVRTDIDGTNKQTLVTSGTNSVQDLGSNLQVTSTNIYWVEKTNDRKSQMLVRTDIDGTNKQTLVISGSSTVQRFGLNLQVADQSESMRTMTDSLCTCDCYDTSYIFWDDLLFGRVFCLTRVLSLFVVCYVLDFVCIVVNFSYLYLRRRNGRGGE